MEESPRFIVLKDKLGSGGFGAVFKGFDRVKNEDVAVKVLQVNTAEASARFEREVAIMRELAEDARSIPILFDGSVQTARCYIMPCYTKGSLERYATQGMPPKKALAVVKAIASSLILAHEKGIIHNDLKPDNILITNEGNLVIGDWGLAYSPREKSITQEGAPVAGTFGYTDPECMSPTTAYPCRTLITSDMYSLGRILERLSAPHPVVSFVVGRLTGVRRDRPQTCLDALDLFSAARSHIEEREKILSDYHARVKAEENARRALLAQQQAKSLLPLLALTVGLLGFALAGKK